VIDNNGKHHDLIIPNTVLVPIGTLPFRLLSPQHFGQETFKQGVDSHAKGTHSLTSGADNILSWATSLIAFSTKLLPGSNIALINSDAGYTKFLAFVKFVEPADEPVNLFSTHLIPDDETISSDTNNDTSISPLPLPEATNEGENEGGPPTSATSLNPV
jgi:hypothetical protein